MLHSTNNCSKSHDHHHHENKFHVKWISNFCGSFAFTKNSTLSQMESPRGKSRYLKVFILQRLSITTCNESASSFEKDKLLNPTTKVIFAQEVKTASNNSQTFQFIYLEILLEQNGTRNKLESFSMKYDMFKK